MLPHYALRSAPLALSSRINKLYWHEWKYDINIGTKKKKVIHQQKVATPKYQLVDDLKLV